ncbi:hypothetical protein AAMO2058_000734100 [Amorphochlora amoebiformis]
MLALAVVTGILMVEAQRMLESERVAAYRKRYGMEWPPSSFPRHTDGWQDYRREWEVNISRSFQRDARWHQWQNLVQSMHLRNFSTLGFELVDLPKEIWGKLRDFALEQKLEDIPFERKIDSVGISPRPRYIDASSIADNILEKLKTMHEKWSGEELILSKSYGLRYYLEGSTLEWHLDKVETHVVSGILHIASEPDQDTEPWPLEIMGIDGKHHKVVLRPGQLLFYESAKLMHGRPSTYTGKWYTSVFLHYRPKKWNYRREYFGGMVPPDWDGSSELGYELADAQVPGVVYHDTSARHDEL